MMPPLPKQNKKREADFGVEFRHWIEKNPRYSCSLEIKRTVTDSIPFSEIKPEQIAWALSISGPKGALIRVQGLTGEPDYIWCCNMPAYVVIRYPKSFYLIHIDAFVLEKQQSKRRSLSSARAQKISTIVVEL